MNRPVNIELYTTITDEDMEETNKVTSSGELISNKGIDMVTYDEHLEEEGIVKNTITIQPNKVSVKRNGIVKMNQLFREGEKSENIYQHPHGRIHMETYTHLIDYDPVTNEKPGRLTMKYHVSLNGQDPRHHQLILRLK